MPKPTYSPAIKRDLDRLAILMRDVPPERVAAVLDRSVRVNFNVTPQQHEEIRGAAGEFGLSVTDYFMRLHDLARQQLKAKSVRRGSRSA